MQETSDRVTQLRTQGYTNSQIIEILQRDGIPSAQIYDALNKSEVPSAEPLVPKPPPHPASTGSIPPLPELPPINDSAVNDRGVPPQANPGPAPITPPPASPVIAPAPATQSTGNSTNSNTNSSIPPQPQPVNNAIPHQKPPLPVRELSSGVSAEEYIESVIDEKWTELEGDIQKIIEWKNRSEKRISSLEQSFNDLKDRFEKLHAALIGKIESYDKNILEVGAEIKAMEKVFSKVLPVFTDNVKQLADVAQRIDKKTR